MKKKFPVWGWVIVALVGILLLPGIWAIVSHLAGVTRSAPSEYDYEEAKAYCDNMVEWTKENEDYPFYPGIYSNCVELYQQCWDKGHTKVVTPEAKLRRICQESKIRDNWK